ncbi:MAG: hypothetical protein ACK5B9_09905 [Flavobacteriia bacterium]|jgi:hypothetical protein
MKTLFTLLSLQTFLSLSQPTPIETMIGHKRIFGFSLINKNFKDSSRFGFFSLTTFNGDYKNIDNELVTSNQLTFALSKRLKIAAGTSFNGLLDFYPSAGFQYTYFKPSLLFVLNPGFEFNNSVATQNFAILEWKKSLSPKLKLYTRIQLLYIYNLQNKAHERSFTHFRLGLNKLNNSFGLGYNADFYGDGFYRIDNLGVFWRHEFF